MPDFYTPAQRRLQDEFETRRLADLLIQAIVTPELNPQQIEFIHARNMFFLSTVDEDGFPSSSYKGGVPGFVRVPSPRVLVFPAYDGNGMFMSLGNIEARTKVGLLFVDFEKPRRMRVRGEARLLRDGPMLKSYPGAKRYAPSLPARRRGSKLLSASAEARTRYRRAARARQG